MKKLVPFLIIGVVVFFVHQREKQQRFAPEEDLQSSAQEPAAMNVEVDTTKFHCDGRQYCSQMTSCAEAMYFLQNCPNVKMDGDNGGRGDGIPCERQWCGSH
jgi:hypothetical protein